MADLLDEGWPVNGRCGKYVIDDQDIGMEPRNGSERRHGISRLVNDQTIVSQVRRVHLSTVEPVHDQNPRATISPLWHGRAPPLSNAGRKSAAIL
jgi:hypothetical protein